MRKIKVDKYKSEARLNHAALLRTKTWFANLFQKHMPDGTMLVASVRQGLTEHNEFTRGSSIYMDDPRVTYIAIFRDGAKLHEEYND